MIRFLSRLIAHRKAKDALSASLKPNPDYRRRRLAHLPPHRVRRYWENVEALRG